MGEPGMGEPGMGESPGGGAGDESDPFAAFTMPSSRYRSSQEALKKAVDAAFAGVDMAELETAWRETMRRVK